jgi:hypothetical protein
VLSHCRKAFRYVLKQRARVLRERAVLAHRARVYAQDVSPQLLRCQYQYFCTSKASKLSTAAAQQVRKLHLQMHLESARPE